MNTSDSISLSPENSEPLSLVIVLNTFETFVLLSIIRSKSASFTGFEDLESIFIAL